MRILFSALLIGACVSAHTVTPSETTSSKILTSISHATTTVFMTTPVANTTAPPICKRTTFFEVCNPDSFGLHYTECSRVPPTGPICDIAYCPRNCSGHGSCKLVNWQTDCFCDSGYVGQYCSELLCPKDCSGNGRCDAINGACLCFNGYAGPACDIVLCPNNCTNHGVCDVKTGLCKCSVLYSGDDCSRAPSRLYNESWGAVFSFSLAVAVVVIIHLVNVSRLHWLPDSISAIFIGMAVGIGLKILETDPGPYLVQKNSIFLVYLPLILFESGFSLQHRQFFSNVGSILVFALLGTLISTVVTSLFIYNLGRYALSAPLDLRASFTFGALISAVDPVAILAIFQAMRVDSTLYILAFGESVLNDAVSIVIFETFRTLFYIHEKFDLVEAVLHCVWSLCGSVVIGTVFGLALTLLLKFMIRGQQEVTAEVSLVFLFAYLSYVSASSLQMSGIVAIIICAIMIAHYAQLNMSPQARLVAHGLSKSVSFTCENLMFAYLGLYLTSFKLEKASIKLALWSVLLVLPLSRAFNIFPLSRLINVFRITQISSQHQVIMWFSGLRGIIAFSLSLSVPGPDQDILAPATILIVVFSVVVFGGGASPLLKWLSAPSDPSSENLNLSKGAQTARSELDSLSSDRPQYESLNLTQNWFDRMDEKYLIPAFCIEESEAISHNLFHATDVVPVSHRSSWQK